MCRSGRSNCREQGVPPVRRCHFADVRATPTSYSYLPNATVPSALNEHSARVGMATSLASRLREDVLELPFRWSLAEVCGREAVVRGRAHTPSTRENYVIQYATKIFWETTKG